MMAKKFTRANSMNDLTAAYFFGHCAMISFIDDCYLVTMSRFPLFHVIAYCLFIFNCDYKCDIHYALLS